MKHLTYFITTMLLLSVLLSAESIFADTPWLHTDGNVIKDPSGNTVVLRGVDTVDIGAVEDWYGGLINMIDRLTNQNDSQGSSPGWYTKVIRFACYPPDAEDFTDSPFQWEPGDDSFYETLLRPAVDYCALKGIYCIIDLHYVANTYSHVAMASDFWTYMAPRFANDSHVIFELFNEPINTSGTEDEQWLSVRTDMETWINIVRTYAPDNLILIAGPSWSQIIGPAADYPLSDDNVVMVSHIYPYHWLVSPAGNNQFTASIDQCLTRYPVFMSEWGFWSDSSDQLGYGSISNYGQPLMDFCEERKISNSAWVASYDWKPPMFYEDWTLRVGEYEMGGFVKDMLYNKRNADQPVGNTPPHVSIVAPSDGSIYNEGADIVIQVDAFDSGGSISQVQFYRGSTLLGTDTSSPYSYTWSNASTGSYSLTAVATDNSGSSTTSPAVSISVVGGGLPDGWSAQDIGSPALAGHVAYANGTYTVEGGGDDIWNTSDNFYFVYSAISGDSEIVARVTSIENTNVWAKAGVMYRESLNGGSINAMTCVTPDDITGLSIRTSTGGESTMNQSTGTVPLYLRLVRSSNTFTAYSSTDGSNWAWIDQQSVTMADSVYVGLAVTSHNDGFLCTGVFDNVSVTGGGTTTTTTTSATTSTTTTAATTSTTTTAATTSTTTTSGGGCDCGTCDWYGTNIPMCCESCSGWGWYDGGCRRSCVCPSSCEGGCVGSHCGSTTTTAATTSTTTTAATTSTTTTAATTSTTTTAATTSTTTTAATTSTTTTAATTSTTTTAATTSTTTTAATTSTTTTAATTSTTTTTAGAGCTCDSGCDGTSRSVPFSQNGSGTYCWQVSDSINYINSWSLNKLEINGVDYTNIWSNSFPARIDGVYYIYYEGSVPWSHFEAN